MAKVATKTYNPETKEIVIEFANGKKVNFNCAVNLPLELVDRAVAHGIMQKLGDSYAGAQSIEDAVAACQTVADNLTQGVWNAGRASSGTGGILAEALARATGQTLDDASGVVNGLDDAKRKELQRHPEIKAKMAEIRAERAAAKAGGDATSLDNLFAKGKGESTKA